MAVSLHIIIPTHYRQDSLLHLLGQLSQQQTEGLNYTVWVILSGPDPETQKAITLQFPACHVIQGQGDWWWTMSVNFGIYLALQKKVAAVLLLNDDINLKPDYLHHLYNAAKINPQAIIGSLNITEEKNPKIFFSGADRYCWFIGKLLRYHPFLSPYDPSFAGLHKSVVLPGRGLWIPAGVFKQIGFFDQQELPQYKADYDFVYRAYVHGIQTLICWDAVVYNPVHKTGAGAAFIKQRPREFFAAAFNEHSRSNLRQNTLYYFRRYPRWALPLFPLSALAILVRQLFLFFTSHKYPLSNKHVTATVA